MIPSSTDDAAPRARRALREKYESKRTYELQKYRNLHADESFAEWSSDKTGRLSAVEAENLDRNGDKETLIRYGQQRVFWKRSNILVG